MQKKILVVEDDGNIADLIRIYLEKDGFEVKIAGDGGSAIQMYQEYAPNLVLLDVMLPVMDGWQVCSMIRKTDKTPIIMLTAKEETDDKVHGLELGADDYITKPFEVKELLARIRVALKLHPVSQHAEEGAAKETPKEEGQLSWGPLLLDIPRHRVTMNAHEISLTNREFLMLQTLLENMDIVLSRDTLLEKVCGYEYVGETNVIDVYIRYLRSKIDDVFSVQMIRTVRGVGYVINKWEDCG